MGGGLPREGLPEQLSSWLELASGGLGRLFPSSGRHDHRVLDLHLEGGGGAGGEAGGAARPGGGSRRGRQGVGGRGGRRRRRRPGLLMLLFRHVWSEGGGL